MWVSGVVGQFEFLSSWANCLKVVASCMAPVAARIGKWTSAVRSEQFQDSNGASFVQYSVEAAAGILSYFTALLADSIDMLGDAIVYGVSLYASSRGVI